MLEIKAEKLVNSSQMISELLCTIFNLYNGKQKFPFESYSWESLSYPLLLLSLFFLFAMCNMKNKTITKRITEKGHFLMSRDFLHEFVHVCRGILTRAWFVRNYLYWYSARVIFIFFWYWVHTYYLSVPAWSKQ